MPVEHGGKNVYGATMGIMMLETQFPRIHGDIGNAQTWPFPVQYKIVRGANPDNVVRQDPTLLLDLFVDAAHELIALGCDGLTTNCGFLALIQDELAKRVPVPVAVSSLMQIPSVQKMLPSDKRVGVITISAESLTDAHLRAAGVDDPSQVPVVGTDAGRAFTHGILDDQPTIDYDACKLDLADAASDLMAKAPDVGAIVLECTNMVPYAADIRKQTGLPVYSIYSLVTWFQQGLLPRKFPFELDDPR